MFAAAGALSFLSFWGAGVPGLLALFVVGGAVCHTRRAGRAAVLRAAESSAWGGALERTAAAFASGGDLARSLEVGARSHEDLGKSTWGRVGLGPVPVLVQAAAAARMGGDPAEFLIADCSQSASRLAGCLVGARTLGLSPRLMLLDVAAAETRREQVAREVRLALASARATARLLAALPIVGLGFVQLISVHGSRILFASSFGRGCLVLAATLEAVGLWWMQRISDGASR